LFFYTVFNDLITVYINSGLAQNFLQRFLILAAIITVYYRVFCRIVFQFVNRIVGFYPRILKELDHIINSKSKSYLELRQGDYAKELIVRINLLIDKCSKR